MSLNVSNLTVHHGAICAINQVSIAVPTGKLAAIIGANGAGKTTLLNRILTEQHGEKIAVIENEFGETGIDNDILLQDRDEQIVEMNNGCLCCSVRGDLRRALDTLAERRAAGEVAFDRVLIETTGGSMSGSSRKGSWVKENAPSTISQAAMT